MASKGNNMSRLFGGNKRELRTVSERAAADQQAPKEEKPLPGTVFAREAPPLAVYLDPDVDHGRKRIILMLSEDGTIIEPIMRLGNLSLVDQLSLMTQETALLVEQMIALAVQGEQANNQLVAEVEFLREQIRKNAQPPAPTVTPRPFEVVNPTIEAGD
jgi:hypothetical protein